jgi:hypothetical protein
LAIRFFVRPSRALCAKASIQPRVSRVAFAILQNSTGNSRDRIYRACRAIGRAYCILVELIIAFQTRFRVKSSEFSFWVTELGSFQAGFLGIPAHQSGFRGYTMWWTWTGEETRIAGWSRGLCICPGCWSTEVGGLAGLLRIAWPVQGPKSSSKEGGGMMSPICSRTQATQLWCWLTGVCLVRTKGCLEKAWCLTGEATHLAWRGPNRGTGRLQSRTLSWQACRTSTMTWRGNVQQQGWPSGCVWLQLTLLMSSFPSVRHCGGLWCHSRHQ